MKYKKQIGILSALLLLVSVFVYAQLQIGVGGADRIGIGTTDPQTSIHIESGSILINNSDAFALDIRRDASPRILVTGYSNVNSQNPTIDLIRYDGTQDDKNATTNVHRLGSINFNGYNGSVEYTGAAIRSTARQNWGASKGVDMEFYTTVNNNNTIDVRMTIQNDGDVDVVGELTAGTKTFKIDNPENPLYQTLHHVNTESPEALVEYRGTSSAYNNGHGWSYTVTDLSTTEHIIMLPSWFNDLTYTGNNYNEYTGHLTGIKSMCGDAYFDFDNVGNNQVRIVTEKACEFSWSVQAVRHDAFYESHTVDVVQDKGPQYTEERYDDEKGKYIDPKWCVHEAACVGIEKPKIDEKLKEV